MTIDVIAPSVCIKISQTKGKLFLICRFTYKIKSPIEWYFVQHTIALKDNNYITAFYLGNDL